MDLDIYDELARYFCNIKITVDYIELITYKIILEIDASEYSFLYKWDAKLTFDKNIDNIKKEIKECILKYYKR